jgi:phenylacetate-coenzyme A ligase PaaK-like adenylate-forming protein
VTLPLAQTVERLNALQPSVLVGYPSRLAQLADEQRAGRLGISLLTVVSTSEMLTDSLRSAITAGFSVPIVNTFASTEGLVAHSEPDGKELAFATDMSIIELVDAYGDPVPPGTPSACGLVTNLHNFTQPLIRYELTDSLTACPAGTARGDLRATVNGRDDAAFSYGDTVVHPLTIRTVMTGCAAVNEYQVRQTERGVDVLIVTGDQVDRRRLTRAVAASLREAGLTDPAVDVRIVGSLERHPETGKARRFIPLGSPTRP